MNEEVLSKAVEELGTPLYIYRKVEDRICRMRCALGIIEYDVFFARNLP